jgi:hypothetical protein
MSFKRGLTYGVGINDASYNVTPKVNGVYNVCLIYRAWHGMLKRCYSKKYQAKHPSYAGCTVCDEWLTFSNFKRWMESQEWQGKSLDKDFIVAGNRLYSPERCAFIDSFVNSFIVDCRVSVRNLKVGVTKRNGKFAAQCRDPFKVNCRYLGLFDTEDCAHEAWRARKHIYACQLADLQTDERIANALRTRYLESNYEQF